MTRFRKTSEQSHPDGLIETFVLELRPGHTVTRVDQTSRLGAGRKGRAAEVSVHRTLDCTCGGRVGMGGLTVAEDLAKLRHFDSPEERDATLAADAELRDAVLRSLGLG